MIELTLSSYYFLAVIRVRGVKFGRLFDLVLIGDARQLEVFTDWHFTSRSIKARYSQSLINQNNDSVNVIVVKE